MNKKKRKIGRIILTLIMCFSILTPYFGGYVAADEKEDCKTVVETGKKDADVTSEGTPGTGSIVVKTDNTQRYSGHGDGCSVLTVGTEQLYLFSNTTDMNNYKAQHPDANVGLASAYGYQNPMNGYSTNPNYVSSVNRTIDNILNSGGNFDMSDPVTKFYVESVAKQVGIENSAEAVYEYLAKNNGSNLELHTQPGAVIVDTSTGEVIPITSEWMDANPDRLNEIKNENFGIWAAYVAQKAAQGGQVDHDDRGEYPFEEECPGGCDPDPDPDIPNDDPTPPVVVPDAPPSHYDIPKVSFNVSGALDSCSPPSPPRVEKIVKPKRQNYEHVADCATDPTYVSRTYEYEPLYDDDGERCGVELETETVIVINYPSAPDSNPLLPGETFNWGPLSSYVKSTTSVWDPYEYQAEVVNMNAQIAAVNSYIGCLQGNLDKLDKLEEEFNKQKEEAIAQCKSKHAEEEANYELCKSIQNVLNVDDGQSQNDDSNGNSSSSSSGNSNNSSNGSSSGGSSGNNASVSEQTQGAIGLLVTILNMVSDLTSGENSSGNSGSSSNGDSSGNVFSQATSTGCVPPDYDCNTEADEAFAEVFAEIAIKREEINDKIQGAGSLLSASEGEYNRLRACGAKLENYKSSGTKFYDPITVDTAYMTLSNGYKQQANTVTGIEKNSGELIIGSNARSWPIVATGAVPTDGSFERYARFTIPINTKNGTTGELRLVRKETTVTTTEHFYADDAEYPEWNSLVDDSVTGDQLSRGFYDYYGLLLKYVDNDVSTYRFDEFYDAWYKVVKEGLMSRGLSGEDYDKGLSNSLGKCTDRQSCWKYLNDSYNAYYKNKSYTIGGSFSVDLDGKADTSMNDLYKQFGQYEDEVRKRGFSEHEIKQTASKYKATDLFSFYQSNQSTISTAIYSIVGQNTYESAVTDDEIEQFNGMSLAGKSMNRTRTIVIPADDTYVCNISVVNPYFCTDTCEDSNAGNTNLVYRSIELNNPFPDANGANEMREMGKNWNSTIADIVITNNRGVKTDKVYTLEPMYTITLTPTVIKEIQKYNADTEYSDFNLNCDSTGNFCTSSFLRNFLPSINAISYENSCAISLNGRSDWYDCDEG